MKSERKNARTNNILRNTIKNEPQLKNNSIDR